MQYDLSRWVPVVSSTGKPLMPCHPARARKLVDKGKAISRWRRGIYYIALTEREDGDVQTVAIGVDPGSKREGYTVMSAKRTFVNILSHAINGQVIKKAMETRAAARRSRRGRNTPCRQPRFYNRGKKDWIPPSTKARWQLKLNVILQLTRLYPITHVAIEDVAARTKKDTKRWNHNFSLVQTGKNWLYNSLEIEGYDVIKFHGYETAQLREQHGLHKTKQKMLEVFSAHCVDSWVIANAVTGNRMTPDLKDMLILKPYIPSRRQLHRFNPGKNGVRDRYGGTMSLNLKKATLVNHPKYGKCLVGGNNGIDRVSLHLPVSYTRLCQNAKLMDITPISHSPWCIFDITASSKQVKRLRRYHRYQSRQQSARVLNCQQSS